LAFTLVPSSATVPIFSIPASRAGIRTSVNSRSMSPEDGDGVVVGVVIGGNEAERNRIVSRPLQLAVGEPPVG
jgi:hypothetical protein